jgi:hypothetical protein
MSQYLLPFIDPDVVTGSQLAAWLNLWAPALQTTQTGTSRPEGVLAGFMWLKQVSPTVWELMLYDGDQDVLLFTINPTTGQATISGLGTAAGRDVQTGPLDPTAGRLMAVGAFGLGWTGGQVANNLDDPSADRTGFYVHTSGMANFTPPTGQSGGLVQHYVRTTSATVGQAAQIYLTAGSTTPRIWLRTANVNAWGAWTELWTQNNLVLTTGSLDATANRVTRVGDGGILNTGNAPVIVSLDTTASMPSGLMRFSSGVSLGTRPTGAALNGSVFVERFSATIVKQTWTDVVGGSAIAPRSWVRTSSALNTWGAWTEVVLAGTTPRLNNVIERFINYGFVGGGSVNLQPQNGADLSFWMTANTTVTIDRSALTADDESVVFNVNVIGNFAVTWPADILWPEGRVPAYASQSIYTFMMRRLNGGTISIFGFQGGKSMAAAS